MPYFIPLIGKLLPCHRQTSSDLEARLGLVMGGVKVGSPSRLTPTLVEKNSAILRSLRN